jgi:hypothetical protein
MAKSNGMKAFMLEEGKEMIWMEETGDYIILQWKREQLGSINTFVSQLCSIVVQSGLKIIEVEDICPFHHLAQITNLPRDLIAL